jgi:GNAT superfamily N-acetyltransferase
MDGREYLIRPAVVEDAAQYGRIHVAALGETYAHIMPAQFHWDYQQRLAEVIERHRARLQAEAENPAAGCSWVALDGAGAMVGLAAAGPARDAEWQRGAPPSPVALELHHLYTLARTHGTGLGQLMLDAVIGDRAAHLWILENNARAERFYRRNGFSPDGATLRCGPSWHFKPMFRMHRTGR